MLKLPKLFFKSFWKFACLFCMQHVCMYVTNPLSQLFKTTRGTYLNKLMGLKKKNSLHLGTRLGDYYETLKCQFLLNLSPQKSFFKVQEYWNKISCKVSLGFKGLGARINPLSKAYMAKCSIEFVQIALFFLKKYLMTLYGYPMGAYKSIQILIDLPIGMFA